MVVLMRKTKNKKLKKPTIKKIYKRLVNQKSSPRHRGVVYEFLGHRIGDSIPQLFPKPKIILHRPRSNGAIYKYRCVNGYPISNDEIDKVWRCTICFPPPKPIVDNRKVA